VYQISLKSNVLNFIFKWNPNFGHLAHPLWGPLPYQNWNLDISIGLATSENPYVQIFETIHNGFEYLKEYFLKSYAYFGISHGLHII
jgi:hypothetical protein